MEAEQLIKLYYNLGMSYNDILSALLRRHGILISRKHLLRILKDNRLGRRRDFADLDSIFDFVQQQLQGPGKMHGYRWMFTKCRESGLKARKEDVRMILAELDPEGSALRKKRRLNRRQYFCKGPNHIWHTDSYDKLKPYGVCINGCIDGFSRKVIWVNAYKTSSDPKVIAGYFLEALETLGSCPRLVRTDRGTENGVLVAIQQHLRANHTDRLSGEQSYIAGVSTANQRIESWWGILRKEGIEYWIQLLGEVRDQGMFDGGFLDKAILQLCIMGMIQEELQKIKSVWNAHRIRPSTNLNVPAGIPNVMYLAPELWDAEERAVTLDSNALARLKGRCMFRSSVVCDPDVFDLCMMHIEDHGLQFPSENPVDAIDLYLTLRDAIKTQLHDN
ncbi:unnamed protein product [Knipowitschia caucasica]